MKTTKPKSHLGKILTDLPTDVLTLFEQLVLLVAVNRSVQPYLNRWPPNFDVAHAYFETSRALQHLPSDELTGVLGYLGIPVNPKLIGLWNVRVVIVCILAKRLNGLGCDYEDLADQFTQGNYEPLLNAVGKEAGPHKKPKRLWKALRSTPAPKYTPTTRINVQPPREVWDRAIESIRLILPGLTKREIKKFFFFPRGKSPNHIRWNKGVELIFNSLLTVLVDAIRLREQPSRVIHEDYTAVQTEEEKHWRNRVGLESAEVRGGIDKATGKRTESSAFKDWVERELEKNVVVSRPDPDDEPGYFYPLKDEYCMGAWNQFYKFSTKERRVKLKTILDVFRQWEEAQVGREKKVYQGIIKRAADEAGVPTKTLRSWLKQVQIKAKRPKTGKPNKTNRI